MRPTSPKLIKFPRTPHLFWLGEGTPRDDKVLSAAEAHKFLQGDHIMIQEKVDGANIGISFDKHGNLWTQSRGDYFGPCVFRKSHPQFDPLWAWLEERRERLWGVLGAEYILFGEWCFAEHTIHYDALPDWFLAFDLYNRRDPQFRSGTYTVDGFLSPVPQIRYAYGGCNSFKSLLPFVSGINLTDWNQSHLTSGPMEGIYLRVVDSDRDRTEHRAKLVNPNFTPAIDEHWSKEPLARNELRRG